MKKYIALILTLILMIFLPQRLKADSYLYSDTMRLMVCTYDTAYHPTLTTADSVVFWRVNYSGTVQRLGVLDSTTATNGTAKIGIYQYKVAACSASSATYIGSYGAFASVYKKGYTGGKTWNWVAINGFTINLDNAIGTLSKTQIDSDVEVDVKTISTDATAANNAELFFDGTGYAGTNNIIPTVTITGTATAVTTVNGLANNVITTLSIADGAITNPKVADDVNVNVYTITDGAIQDEDADSSFYNDAGLAGWAQTTRTLSALDEDNTTIDLNGTAVGSVTSGVTVADSGISVSSVKDNFITAGKIAASAITVSEAPNLDAAITTRFSRSASDSLAGIMSRIYSYLNATPFTRTASDSLATVMNRIYTYLTVTPFSRTASDSLATVMLRIYSYLTASPPTTAQIRTEVDNAIESLTVAASDLVRQIYAEDTTNWVDSTGDMGQKIATITAGGGSGLDSATTSRLLKRIGWGLGGNGSDSTTAAQRTVTPTTASKTGYTLTTQDWTTDADLTGLSTFNPVTTAVTPTDTTKTGSTIAVTGTDKIWQLRGLHIRGTASSDTAFITKAYGNGIGYYSAGSGTGEGVKFIGGATAHGLMAVGQGLGESGIYAVSDVAGGFGILARGFGSGYAGIKGMGSDNAYDFLGDIHGSIDTANYLGGKDRIIELRGLHIRGTTANDTGFIASGYTTGAGASFIGGSTSGAGLALKGNGTGSGLYTTAGTAGHGIYTVGTGNGGGLYAVGQGTAPGIFGWGGTTGAGMYLLGQGTNAGLKTVKGATADWDISGLLERADTTVYALNAGSSGDSTRLFDADKKILAGITAESVLVDSSAYQGSAAGLSASEIMDSLRNAGAIAFIGSERCSLLVLDADDNPVEDVKVVLRNTAGTTRQAIATSDANGYAIFELDTLTFYRVIVDLAGYTQDNSYDSFTVASGGSFDTVLMTAFDPGTPIDPLKCRLYQCKVTDGFGNIMVNLKVTVTLNSTEDKLYDSTGATIITKSSKKNVVYTDANGFWKADVYKNSEIYKKVGSSFVNAGTTWTVEREDPEETVKYKNIDTGSLTQKMVQ